MECLFEISLKNMSNLEKALNTYDMEKKISLRYLHPVCLCPNSWKLQQCSLAKRKAKQNNNKKNIACIDQRHT